MNDSRGHYDEFCKRAITAVVTAGYPENLAAVAKINFATLAVRTFATVDGGIKGDPIAFFKALHICPGFSNYSGSFMTHHQRWNPPPGRPVITVDVASTYSAGCDPHQYFVASRRRNREIGYFKLTVLREQESFHLGRDKTLSDFADVVRTT